MICEPKTCPPQTSLLLQLRYIRLKDHFTNTQHELSQAQGELIDTRYQLGDTQHELVTTRDELTATQHQLREAQKALVLVNDRFIHTHDSLQQMSYRMSAANDLLDVLLAEENNRFFKRFFAKLAQVLNHTSVHTRCQTETNNVQNRRFLVKKMNLGYLRHPKCGTR